MIRGALTSGLLTPTQLEHYAAAAQQQHLDVVALAPYIPALAHHPELSAIALAGYPTGKQHPLIKAAEARLAIQSGAAGVAVVLDPLGLQAAHDAALLSEVISLRDSVPAPAQFAAVLDLDVVSEQQLEQVLRWLQRAPLDAVVLGSLGVHAPVPHHAAQLLMDAALPRWQQVRSLVAQELVVLTTTKNAPAPIDAGAVGWITDLFA